jgi:hypothetical protein
VSARLTAGKRIRRTLDKALLTRNGKTASWVETELVVLDLIESAADRAEQLRSLFAAEMVKPEISTRRVTEVAAEIRQCEANVAKMVASLDPKAQREQHKSPQHQAASNSRWHPPQGTPPQMEVVRDGPV